MLTASIAATATEVIAQVFTEAQRGDLTGSRPWVMLVDGARYQLDAIHAEATRRKVPVHVVIDFIHVLDYLWKATWCLHPRLTPPPKPGSPAMPWTSWPARQSR